jgi:hypothetical protein
MSASKQDTKQAMELGGGKEGEELLQKKGQKKCRHTTAEIRWWSPTQLLRSR